MLKVLLTVLIILDLAILVVLIIGVIASINAGGGSVLFPGLGLVVALPLVVGAVFVFEMILVGITLIVYLSIKNNSNNLARVSLAFVSGEFGETQNFFDKKNGDKRY